MGPGPALCCMALLLATGSGVLAQNALPAAPAVQELFLEVSVNGEASGQVVRFTQGPRGLRVGVDSLRELGLDPAAFGLQGQGEVDLDQVPGLRYTYDAGRQTLALVLDDALRTPFQLQARRPERMAPTATAPGAVLNYNAYVQVRPQRSALVANELRYFNQRGVLTSTGLLTLSALDKRYLRYETYWNESDPDTLRSFQVGDMISSSLSWNRSLRLGGLQWSKSFALRPDLLTFPVASMRGSAVVPSTLSLYVNGMQQYAASVPSGPFVLNQVAGISGAGEATIVTQDAFGRTITTALPMYVDTRMLAAGLSEYSVETGFVRRGFAQTSFGYRSAPVASASGRYGWSDRLTLEAHGEAAAGLLNAGGGALAGLGQAGVLNANLAASTGQRSGLQGGLGYQYVSRRFSIDAQSQHATRGYVDLAARDGSPVPRASQRLSFNLTLPGEQSLGLSLVSYRAAPAEPARITSLSYAATLFRRVFFSISAYRDQKNRANRGLFFGVSTSFGERYAGGASSGRQNGISQRKQNLSRSPDLDGGLGWALQRGATGDTGFRQAQASYLGRYGQISALAQTIGAASSATLEASGSLVTMGGALAAARNVGGGFALVSTGGVGNVPVLHENRVIGATNAAGYMLIPNLNPYSGNRVSIDTSALPVDARVDRTEATVVPRRLSGTLASFPVQRYRAASVLLRDAQGQPLPLGTPVRHLESGAATIVGYDGIAFIDGLLEDNHLEAGAGSTLCQARFSYQAAKLPVMPVIGPLACLPAGDRP